MPNYIRSKRYGGTFFFTVTLKDRQSTALLDHIELLRESVRFTLTQKPFQIIAWVVLPDHIHAIWKLPESDNDFSLRWQMIKSRFTRKLRETKKYNLSPWQNRFWEHEIQSEEDLEAHIHYVYFNPVKHGYVTSIQDWPYSSVHRDVKRGVYCYQDFL
ncbi:REP-associated tyrosine transposase [Marinomonas arenicola]|uniref:Transposase n=1 Tax=Marinomonas arenicola TaxID=569601 RepID=A0ABU9G1L3_9GAMM